MLKRIINKIKLNYQIKIKHKPLSEIKIENWRKAGITIGKNCIFCSELPVWRDSFLLSFGDNCLVSGNVTFLMHDAAPTTVSNGAGTDFLGKVTIGNSCFIGMYSIIMPGVSLADNTVVGAGSVVTHSTTRPGLVIAGNPARVVCTVEEYLKKNQDKLVNLDGMSASEMQQYIQDHPEKLIQRSEFKTP